MQRSLGRRILQKVRRSFRRMRLKPAMSGTTPGSGARKIFCISFQRCGTTSTGRFFDDYGYNVANYSVTKDNHWTASWFRGDYETIFASADFQANEVFEDNPWWCGDFYKVLFHRFPESRFVLFERDADAWFNSMIAHSTGRTLGNTHIHASLYRREQEFEERCPDAVRFGGEIDNLLPLTEEHRAHYKAIFHQRHREILAFFAAHDRARLWHGRLEDPDKWQKLGAAFGLTVPDDYDAHANSSRGRGARV